MHDTLHAKPKGETHWSTRLMARHAGVSRSTVQRIWHARGLKPHRVDTFKISTDPKFEEKLTDVVGLYLNPPENAIVLCMDEKSQVQALERTQPSLPMTKGRAGTMTHDYKRNGTTTLFAALNVLTGIVIGQCLPQHRHEEFLKFLRTIDREVPKGLAIHLILDNYATHKHADVDNWLRTHKRFHLHFTPTSSSWLNLVERWFRELTDKALRRGSFNSVPDLIATIEDYLAAHNGDPKPFKWTATAVSILEKVRRGQVALQQAINQMGHTTSDELSDAAGALRCRLATRAARRRRTGSALPNRTTPTPRKPKHEGWPPTAYSGPKATTLRGTRGLDAGRSLTGQSGHETAFVVAARSKGPTSARANRKPSGFGCLHR